MRTKLFESNNVVVVQRAVVDDLSVHILVNLQGTDPKAQANKQTRWSRSRVSMLRTRSATSKLPGPMSCTVSYLSIPPAPAPPPPTRPRASPAEGLQRLVGEGIWYYEINQESYVTMSAEELWAERTSAGRSSWGRGCRTGRGR